MGDQMANAKITLGEITSKEKDTQLFQDIRALSISVFEPDTLEEDVSSTNQSSTWQSKIQDPESKVIYALDTTTKPVGCFFIEPRTLPEIGYTLPHIRIACVDPASRGLGIFPRLMEKAKAHATNLGYNEISAATYPKRFIKMYRILNQHGWREVCWLEKDVKVLMKLQL